jgi:hypothetical protein
MGRDPAPDALARYRVPVDRGGEKLKAVVDLLCPKCGRVLELNYGRHARQYWVQHPGVPYWIWGTVVCRDEGKKWLHSDTEEAAIAAFKADNSNFRKPPQEVLDLVNRLIETEIDKARRNRLQGYAG